MVVLYVLLRFTSLDIYALMICNVLFGFVVCVLNWISVGKLLDYKQEVRTTFVLPLIAAVFMGAVTRGAYEVMARFLGDKISCIAAIIIAVPVYFAALILLRAVTKEELLAMPKGTFLVKVLTKLRLLR